MTASERLAALGEEGTVETMTLYHAALPEIVAVVRAAEEVSGPFRTIDPNVQNTLRPALAALDAKLAER